MEIKEEEIFGLFFLDDSENKDKNFSINQRSTSPTKQPNKLNETTPKSLEHFFNKERNVVGRACTEKRPTVID